MLRRLAAVLATGALVPLTGIGVPADEQPEMFQPFFRSSTSRKREIQGTGLGLPIVAAIVEAHGGRIDVRSGHLEGTTITVRLKLADMGHREAASAALPAVVEEARG